jgi:predicted TIM-barrel fold metal-dependent hydrolase
MVFDVHHHVRVHAMPPSLPGSNLPDFAGDLQRRVAYMDRWGIEKAAMLASNIGPAPNGLADRRRDNDRLAAYIAQRPDRFPVGFGTVHPGDGKAGLDEVNRCITELGFKGIVWHHRYLGTTIDHPGMHPILDLLEGLGAYTAVHIVVESSLEAPWRLEMLAEQHPRVTFIALDGFSSYDHASWMAYIARRHPNIYFDIAAAASVAHQFVEFVTQVGAERMLLGTNYAGEPPRLFGVPFPLEEIRNHLDLPLDAVEMILGGNARRLFGI